MLKSVTPSEASSTSSIQKLPVNSRDGFARIAAAASAMISGFRQCGNAILLATTLLIAAVAITECGQSALTAIPLLLNSPAIPSTHWLMPNFDVVYATDGANHLVCISSGGEIFRMWGLSDFSRCGSASRDNINVARTLTANIRSNRFISVLAVFVNEIALALLMQISSPPNASAAWLTAALTCASSRTSVIIGKARPPAASISSAAL